MGIYPAHLGTKVRGSNVIATHGTAVDVLTAGTGEEICIENLIASNSDGSNSDYIQVYHQISSVDYLLFSVAISAAGYLNLMAYFHPDSNRQKLYLLAGDKLRVDCSALDAKITVTAYGGLY